MPAGEEPPPSRLLSPCRGEVAYCREGRGLEIGLPRATTGGVLALSMWYLKQQLTSASFHPSITPALVGGRWSGWLRSNCRDSQLPLKHPGGMEAPGDGRSDLDVSCHPRQRPPSWQEDRTLLRQLTEKSCFLCLTF